MSKKIIFIIIILLIIVLTNNPIKEKITKFLGTTSEKTNLTYSYNDYSEIEEPIINQQENKKGLKEVVSDVRRIIGFEDTKSSEFQEKLKEIEKKILEYTNIERKNTGLSALQWNEILHKSAKAHSDNMAENDFFSHDDPQSRTPTRRAKEAGFTKIKWVNAHEYYIGVAENIGKMGTGNVIDIGYVFNTPDSLAKAQVKSWMQSSGHRENILNPQYSDLGVGVSYDTGDYVSTQNFW
jgi:uncharacterized protein YkwD